MQDCQQVQDMSKTSMPHLVLGRVSNQSLCVCESHIGRGGTVTLIVGDDLHLNWDSKISFRKYHHLSMLEDSDTGVGCSEVDTDSGLLFGNHGDASNRA